MISILIAWALIGAVFFAGFLLEVMDVKCKPWTVVAFWHALVLLLLIVMLWPVWIPTRRQRIAWRVSYEGVRRGVSEYQRGGRRG